MKLIKRLIRMSEIKKQLAHLEHCERLGFTCGVEDKRRKLSSEKHRLKYKY